MVGSDQVWRPAYSDVANYLCGFLSDGDDRPRISYAASFGTSNLDEISRLHLKGLADLAQKFSMISVREDSGIDIAFDMWNTTAERHLDPSLLVPRDAYLRLVQPHDEQAGVGRLVTYVLDATPIKDALADRASHLLRRPVMPLLPTSDFVRWARDRGSFRCPSLETWLGAMANADFVITDSYHGACLSILNHRPFVVVMNEARGSARFETLLGAFGLMNRLIVREEDFDPRLLDEAVDWDRVDEIISRERKRSIDYLIACLPRNGAHTCADRTK